MPSTGGDSGGPSWAPRWKGFTLLHVVTSLIVMALVAVVGIPVYFGRPKITLERAAVLLANDLRLAQNRAAYLGTPVQVVFDDEADGYWFADLEGEHLEDPVGDEAIRRIYPGDAVFEGVTLDLVELTRGSAVYYDARGRCQSGGSITLGYRGQTRVVRVDPGTGMIRVEGTSSGFRDDGR